MIRHFVGSNGGTFNTVHSVILRHFWPGLGDKGGSGTVTFSGSNFYLVYTKGPRGTLLCRDRNRQRQNRRRATSTNGTIVNGGRLIWIATGNTAADPGATVQTALTSLRVYTCRADFQPDELKIRG